MVIISCNERSIDIFNDNVFCFDKGYMYNSTNGFFHSMLMNPPNGMVVDHIKRNPYDNRLENLRIVTSEENSRNMSKPSTNTSGIVGVSQTNRKNGNNDWVAFINDDQGKKRRKSFACKKYGDQEAKQLAIQQRAIWKQELGYLGE